MALCLDAFMGWETCGAEEMPSVIGPSLADMLPHPDDGDDPFDGIFFWHDPMVDGDGGGAVVAACRFFNVH